MLPDAYKKYWDIGSMHHTDQSTNHISNSITFGDDEAIERPPAAECGVEVSRLCDRIGSNQGLCNVSRSCLKDLAELTSPTMRILSGWANLANFSSDDMRRYEILASQETPCEVQILT